MKNFFIWMTGALILCTIGIAKEERVLEATNTLQLIVRKYKEAIPPELISKAYAVAVFPGVTKIGLFVGGLVGDGVMSIRNGGKWESPLYVSIGGGSFGFQFGVERSDILLFIMDSKIIEAIKENKVTLGVDASIAAGPLGLNIGEITDFTLSRDIYSYVINRGLFAGASLGGALIGHDKTVRIEPASFAARSFTETIKRMAQ